VISNSTLRSVERQGAKVPLCSSRKEYKARTESCFSTPSCPHVEHHNSLQKECQPEGEGSFKLRFPEKKGEGRLQQDQLE